jgi:replication factor C subunit 1
MTTSSEWIEKYKPNTISELVVNTGAVDDIKNWLLSFNNTKNQFLQLKNNKKSRSNKKQNGENVKYKSCMIITGGHGHGKTCTVDVILKEMNYDIYYLDIKKIKLCKDINMIITQSMISPNILSVLSGATIKKHIIVVDNLESITSSTEKASIINLQKMNDLNWYCPIVFISNNQHNKLLFNIKKFSHEVTFDMPNTADLLTILTNIANNEGIIFENSFVAYKIINCSQGDIRQLVFILYELKCMHEGKTITFKSVQEYCAASNVRDIDINLYKATNKLLQNYRNINTCMSLYETEKVLLPLMMQENYIKCIIQNYDDDDEKYRLAEIISDSLSMGDITENYIYGEQNWNMQDIHGIVTCVNPSFYININENNKKSDFASSFPIDLIETTKRLEFESSFPADLNKTSIKSINKKNIVNADQCLKNMNIFDYIFISKIIYNYIQNNNIESCIKLLLGYNMEMEYIESLLKINKIKKNKSILSLKQKKEFTTYLEMYKPKI